MKNNAPVRIKPGKKAGKNAGDEMIYKFRKKTLILFAVIIGLSTAVSLGAFYGAKALLTSSFVSERLRPGGVLELILRLLSFVGGFNVFLIVFTVLFITIFWIATKKYEKPLSDVSNGISSISGGDFDVNIINKSNDEIASLARDVNEAAKKLKAAVESGAFAERAKDRVIASVAHDLRTPLTSIAGYLELIVKQKNTEEKNARYAEIAYDKAKRLGVMIDELFEFTTFHYGTIELNKKKIDARCLIEQINEEFLPELNENAMEMRIYTDESPIYVDADGVLLARALENLINNAIKYAKGGKFIDVRAFARNGSAVIQVINYGAKIPDEERELIFEAFYRADKSRQAAGGGAGLGLAIVKSVTEAHGGRVGVESTDERTMFEIELPLAKYEVN